MNESSSAPSDAPVPEAGTLAASVVVVSDYSSTGERSWTDEKRCLAALARQQLHDRFEIIISESENFRGRFPAELLSVAPLTRVVFSSATTSYGLKNAGARAADAPITVILDADCQLAPDWMSILLATMRERPELAVVSGRTSYLDPRLSARILALVTRSYLDQARPAETDFIANNAAGFRTRVLRDHPLPEHLGPFAARMQSESLMRDGHKLWFEPGMKVVHEFEGWPMEADIRRNIGYGTVAIRLDDPTIPYARLVRLGLPAVPVIAAGKLLNTLRDCARCGSAYGVRWFELPLAFGASVAVNAMEIPGMIAAYRGKPIQQTAYR